jgi:hypothetical protein
MSVPEILREFDENTRKARELTAGLSAAQLNWRPEPGRWSIAQCLAHLNVVNGQDLTPIAEAIRSARSRRIEGAPPFHYGPLSRKFIAMMEPPVRSRMKAPASYQPPDEADAAQTLAEYLRIAGELRRLAASSEGLDLRRVKTTLPALPAILRAVVRMPLGARFALIAAHDRRHLWQAEQLRAHPNFPR